MLQDLKIEPDVAQAAPLADAPAAPKRLPSLTERVIELVGEELSPEEQILDDGTLISSHVLRLVSRKIVAGIPFESAYLAACGELKPLFLSGRIGADAPLVNEIIDTGPDDTAWTPTERVALLEELGNVRLFAADNFLAILDGKEAGKVELFELRFPFAEPVYVRIALEVAERTADRVMVDRAPVPVEAQRPLPKPSESAPMDMEFWSGIVVPVEADYSEYDPHD